MAAGPSRPAREEHFFLAPADGAFLETKHDPYATAQAVKAHILGSWEIYKSRAKSLS